MNDRLDRITPGIAAKLTLSADVILTIAVTIMALQAFAWSTVPVIVGAVVYFCASAAVLRLYSPCTPRRVSHDVVLGGFGVVGVTALTAFTHHVVAPANSTFIVADFAVMLFSATTLTRMLFLRMFVDRFEAQEDAVLIVGTGPMGLATYRRFSREPGRRVIGFLRFPGEPASLTADAPVLGNSSQLLHILSDYPMDEVFVAGRVAHQGDDMQDAVRTCEEVGVPFAVPLHSLSFERANLLSSSPARDGYLHYLNFQSQPLQYAIKRLIDIASSGTALLMLSPLLLVVAVLIRLTSRGPVFFKQVRVGLHGAHFNLFKFRSMVVDAERLKATLDQLNEQNGPAFKMRNDPRVTPIGRFIRKYSIDELPQLVNVLRGDMTLVGPRPALPKEVANYKAWQRRRLSVRPGLTCYWQVGGRNEIGFDEWMRLDLRYVDNWSIRVDLQLIMKTFPVVLAGRGAS